VLPLSGVSASRAAQIEEYRRCVACCREVFGRHGLRSVRFCGSLLSGHLSADNLVGALREIREGVTELKPTRFIHVGRAAMKRRLSVAPGDEAADILLRTELSPLDAVLAGRPHYARHYVSYGARDLSALRIRR
jgi:hypothetical protein